MLCSRPWRHQSSSPSSAWLSGSHRPDSWFSSSFPFWFLTTVSCSWVNLHLSQKSVHPLKVYTEHSTRQEVTTFRSWLHHQQVAAWQQASLPPWGPESSVGVRVLTLKSWTILCASVYSSVKQRWNSAYVEVLQRLSGTVDTITYTGPRSLAYLSFSFCAFCRLNSQPQRW